MSLQIRCQESILQLRKTEKGPTIWPLRPPYLYSEIFFRTCMYNRAKFISMMLRNQKLNRDYIELLYGRA